MCMWKSTKMQSNSVLFVPRGAMWCEVGDETVRGQWTGRLEDERG